MHAAPNTPGRSPESSGFFRPRRAVLRDKNSQAYDITKRRGAASGGSGADRRLDHLSSCSDPSQTANIRKAFLPHVNATAFEEALARGRRLPVYGGSTHKPAMHC